MKTAAQLFDIEVRTALHPLVREVWRTTSVPEARFISVATPDWEIAITRQDERAWVTVRGPETSASISPIPRGAEFIGIRFARGAFMPTLPPSRLVDDSLELPSPERRSFWLEGAAWELPRFDDLHAFVSRLVAADLLVFDPIAAAALDGGEVDHSERSVQRRVARATGLSRRLIAQIERAEAAAAMLMNGSSIGDVVSDLRYADQAHLTRSVRRFIGQTPSEIVRSPAPA
jgi:hypothetical protein